MAKKIIINPENVIQIHNYGDEVVIGEFTFTSLIPYGINYRDSEGNPKIMYGTIKDVTSRKINITMEFYGGSNRPFEVKKNFSLPDDTIYDIRPAEITYSRNTEKYDPKMEYDFEFQFPKKDENGKRHLTRVSVNKGDFVSIKCSDPRVDGDSCRYVTGYINDIVGTDVIITRILRNKLDGTFTYREEYKIPYNTIFSLLRYKMNIECDWTCDAKVSEEETREGVELLEADSEADTDGLDADSDQAYDECVVPDYVCAECAIPPAEEEPQSHSSIPVNQEDDSL